MVCVSDRDIFPLVISLADNMQLKRRDSIQHAVLRRIYNDSTRSGPPRRNPGDTARMWAGSVQIARNDADRIRLY